MIVIKILFRFCEINNQYTFTEKILCFIQGEWNPDCNVVLYSFTRNDLTARTHDSYLDAAREAQRRSNGRRDVSIDGIKSLFNFTSGLKNFFFTFVDFAKGYLNSLSITIDD